MAAISAADVKKLRDLTGAGMMDCKKALAQADGDFAGAEKILKEMGLAAVAKRQDRATDNGRVFVASNGKKVVMLSLSCETDFVAKNDDFKKLGEDLCSTILEKGYTEPNDELKGMVDALIAIIKENMNLVSFSVTDIPENGYCASYVHGDGAVAVSVILKADNASAFEADSLTYRYEGRDVLWQKDPLSFSILSGERIWLQGDNGSGKTTLLKLIAGSLQPTTGKIWRRDSLNILYLDQEYSCIDNDKTVYGLLESCNSKKPEHELKMLLDRFMFTAQTWDKKCACLSGGERMKLALCRLLIAEKAPDIIIADEPTNNIDISCMDILADTLKNYVGTLLIVSHDEQFIHDIGIKRIISIS